MRRTFLLFLSFCCRVILWRIDRVENDLKSLVLDRFYGKLFQLWELNNIFQGILGYINVSLFK